jgi:site-specific recombinase XerD
VSPYFKGTTVRHIQPHHCERWLAERVAKLAPQTLVHELDTMRLIFDYAVRIGLMVANPVRDIKRRKIVSKPIEVPTREQFKRLVEAITASRTTTSATSLRRPA